MMAMKNTILQMQQKFDQLQNNIVPNPGSSDAGSRYVSICNFYRYEPY